MIEAFQEWLAIAPAQKEAIQEIVTELHNASLLCAAAGARPPLLGAEIEIMPLIAQRGRHRGQFAPETRAAGCVSMRAPRSDRSRPTYRPAQPPTPSTGCPLSSTRRTMCILSLSSGCSGWEARRRWPCLSPSSFACTAAKARTLRGATRATAPRRRSTRPWCSTVRAGFRALAPPPPLTRVPPRRDGGPLPPRRRPHAGVLRRQARLQPAAERYGGLLPDPGRLRQPRAARLPADQELLRGHHGGQVLISHHPRNPDRPGGHEVRRSGRRAGTQPSRRSPTAHRRPQTVQHFEAADGGPGPEAPRGGVHAGEGGLAAPPATATGADGCPTPRRRAPSRTRVQR